MIKRERIMRNRNNFKKYFWVLNISILISFSISSCKNQSLKCGLKQNLGKTIIYEKDSFINSTTNSRYYDNFTNNFSKEAFNNNFNSNLFDNSDLSNPFDFEAKTYYQVFANNKGFTQNLSCLDALFNVGLETKIL